jgi:hypothetical protein
LYNDYLNALSQLTRDAGEFYGDQLWVSDSDQSALNGVYELPTTVNGAEISREQLESQSAATTSAGESIGDNIYHEYGTEIENGANFAGGFSDGVLFGVPGMTYNALGRDWVDTYSEYYTGGMVTAMGATLIGSGGSVLTTRALVSGGRSMQVTTYASNDVTAIINSGKWVVTGRPSWYSYFKTGLWGGKYGNFTGPRFVGWGNPATGQARLSMPSSRLWGKDGNWKSYFWGQFKAR